MLLLLLPAALGQEGRVVVLGFDDGVPVLVLSDEPCIRELSKALRVGVEVKKDNES